MIAIAFVIQMVLLAESDWKAILKFPAKPFPPLLQPGRLFLSKAVTRNMEAAMASISQVSDFMLGQVRLFHLTGIGPLPRQYGSSK